MNTILGMVIATFLVTSLGGGIGYFLWLKTRPKKETWDARIYTTSLGVQPRPKNKFGKLISDIQLKDLIPVTHDIIEKVEKKVGGTTFRLLKLNKPLEDVRGMEVERWGNKRVVNVLQIGDAYTTLTKGYDAQTGKEIFRPLPHSKINMIKSEITLRKSRLRKEKDILEAISPWIVAGIIMLGLVAISYIMVSGFIEMSENNLEASKSLKEGMIEGAKYSSGYVEPPTDFAPQNVINAPLVEGG